MDIYKTFLTYRRLAKQQWLPRQEMRAIQARKLQNLVRHAYNTVPYYTDLFDRAGLAPGDIRCPEDLWSLPTTSKANLQQLTSHSVLSGAYQEKDLITERTSGSTGRPFSISFDRNFLITRNALFLRSLSAAGYRFGRKLFLITSSFPPKGGKRLLRWKYGSILQSPTTLYSDIDQFGPDILYGCMTTLRLLAQFVMENNLKPQWPQKIVSTAEQLDPPTRTLLEQVFDAEVFQFYGLTEIGQVGWECSEHRGFHLAEDTSLLEYVPVAGNEQLSQLVVTNLDLLAMPMIRFETGDVGTPGSNTPCPCGRHSAMLDRVEGRLIDCITLADGRVLSPYTLTCQLENIKGVTRYQVIQRDYDSFQVLVESRHQSSSLETEIIRTMRSILGDHSQVEVTPANTIAPEPGSKFRVVHSNLKQGEGK